MTGSNPPAPEGSSAGGGRPPQPSDEPETYPIPGGGLADWIPGEISPPSPRDTLHKVEPRDEPRRAKKAAEARRRTGGASAFWALCGFNLLVFVSSVCVMMLELTASRLVAKHVGSSLYTWTSVIGVVLAGITVGNYLGGWLADRFPRGRTLAWMYLFGSAACASVLWLDQLVSGLERPETMSWPTWVLCVVALVFLLPSLALGTTSPLVASMALERSTRTGQTVGNVYAWGALGSIIGTFVTGFYLIDVWGTRSIVGLTSATLAVLAFAVAGQRWVFRTAVLLGWLQFLSLLVLAATSTKERWLPVGQILGSVRALGKSEIKAMSARTQMLKFAEDLGDKLHELGLLLKLRDDSLGGYHDESSYSYIQVIDDYNQGEPVRCLRLDKLIHSYYEPGNPTALHYEYEQVYAAVTKRAAPSPAGALEVAVPEFPGWKEVVSRLPPRATFNESTRTLRIEGADAATLDALLALSTDLPYWKAIEQLAKDTAPANWGGFSTVALDQLPEGMTWPQDLVDKVRYDAHLTVLTAYERVDAQVRERLLAASPQAPWRQAVESLRKSAGRITALFVGGGGFIFPRWVAAEFPGAERIDVAELDPAVYRAVQKELGLSADDERRIHTVIGDARNFVEDRLRENRRLVAAQQPPVLYDFVYGDAFNDFSVPFHLASLEFTQKVRQLMSPVGVLQQNIIEIYPRTEIPGATVGSGRAEYAGQLPDDLFVKPPRARELPAVKPRYAPVMVKRSDAGPFVLEAAREVPSDVQQALVRLDPQNAAWCEAVEQLGAQTRAKRTVKIPAALQPARDPEASWTPCPSPFEGVEAYRVGQDRYALALRGAASDALSERLLALQPQDAEWQALIRDGVRRSRAVRPGRFLARYAQTMAAVFPYIYVFSTSQTQPTDDRDTYVLVCSNRQIDLQNLEDTGLWKGKPFAWREQPPGQPTPTLGGQMDSLLALSGGRLLTDDFAPVDNLLRPVFAEQD